MIAALLLSLIGQELPSTRVTFSTKAADAVTVTAALSKAAGVALEASPEMGKDILVVHLKDVPLGEAMRKVAEATQASWHRTNEGFVLRRTDDDLRRERESYLSARESAFRRAIAEAKKTESQAPPFDDVAARALAEAIKEARQTDPQRASTLYGRTPGRFIVQSAFGMLDAAELARLPAGSRYVFSTSPTKAQRPLPRDIWKICAEYVQAENRWRLLHEQIVGMNMGDALPDKPAQVLVVVTPSQSNCETQFILTTAQGASLGSSVAYFSLGQFNREDRVRAQESREDMLAFSDDAIIARTRIMAGRTVAPAALTSKLRQSLLNPEQVEPLSLMVSEGFSSFAEIKSRNIVASLSDSCFDYGPPRPQGSTPAAFFLLMISLEHSVTDDGKWLTVRPLDSRSAREARIDRRDLGLIARSVDTKQNLPQQVLVSVLAKYDVKPVLLPAFLRALEPAAAPPRDFDWDLARFYGRLTDSQKKALQDGQSLEIGRLTPAQRSVLPRFLNRPDAVAWTKGGSSEGGSEGETSKAGEGSSQWSGVTEPTELVPNGPEYTGRIYMSHKVDDVLLVDWRNGRFNEPYGVAVPSAIAEQIVQMERNETIAPNQLIGELRTGRLDTISLYIQHNAIAHQTPAFQHRSYTGDGWVTADKLPEPYKSKILREVEQSRRIPGKPGQRPPVPPPGPRS